MISLGREPQDLGDTKNSEPRSGDRKEQGEGRSSRGGHNLSPLRGSDECELRVPWGSRPRLRV